MEPESKGSSERRVKIERIPRNPVEPEISD